MVFFTSRGKVKRVYSPIFSENSWNAIIEACHAEEVPSEWVADGTCYKDMEINGTNYRIDIIGKNHDTYTAGGTAPLTFCLHDCYGTAYPMNASSTNVGGWGGSQMRTQTMPELKLLLPEEVQAGIRPVNKLTSSGGNLSTIQTTSDDLFLLSEIEIFGSVFQSFPGEGTQYEYYQAGNSKEKNLNNTPDTWNERSPRSSAATFYFCAVYSGGGSGASTANIPNGVSFAFCF